MDGEVCNAYPLPSPCQAERCTPPPLRHTRPTPGNGVRGLQPTSVWMTLCTTPQRCIIRGRCQSVVYTNNNYRRYRNTQQTRNVEPMLFYWRPSVADDGPSVKQHRLNVLCFLWCWLLLPMKRNVRNILYFYFTVFVVFYSTHLVLLVNNMISSIFISHAVFVVFLYLNCSIDCELTLLYCSAKPKCSICLMTK